jgi:hypothetical protein
MATPTFAELVTQFKAIMDFYKETILFASERGSGDNFVGIEDGLVQALESDYADEITGGVESMRASLNALYVNGTPLFAHFRDWARLLALPDNADVQTIIDGIYAYFVANTESVKTRAITYGAPTAAGGNTGTGVMRRVTTDAEGIAVENVEPEVKTVICTSDVSTGATRNQEAFEFRGTDPGRDSIERRGTGLIVPMAAKEARAQLLLNAGFDEPGGTPASPSSIPNWTSSITVNSTNYAFDSTNVFLPVANGNETRYSLQIKAAGGSRTLTQRLDTSGITLSRFLPYYCAIAYETVTGGLEGTLAIALGSKSNSVALDGSQEWSVLEFQSALTTGLWYQNFVADPLTVVITITVTGGTTGNIDDVLLAGMDAVDGSFYILRPGRTAFRAGSVLWGDGDRFTITDTIATDSVIQRHLARLTGRYLRSSASPTVTDP